MKKIIETLEKMKTLCTMVLPQKKDDFDVAISVAIESVKRMERLNEIRRRETEINARTDADNLGHSEG